MTSNSAVISVLSTLVVAAIVLLQLASVHGHGSVHDPVCRQTRWRYNSTAKANYDDNQLFCGGFNTQFAKNGGRCGMCGDNWSSSQPRQHELGGKYGDGVIVASYKSGGELPVSVLITANHKGKFQFRLCNLDTNGGVESDACFGRIPLLLVDGSAEYRLTSGNNGRFNVVLRIPPYVRCEHCVLQWTYVAGNNWGICANGGGQLGCGPQENFRSCSDVRIV